MISSESRRREWGNGLDSSWMIDPKFSSEMISREISLEINSYRSNCISKIIFIWNALSAIKLSALAVAIMWYESFNTAIHCMWVFGIVDEFDFSHQTRKLMWFLLNLIYRCQTRSDRHLHTYVHTRSSCSCSQFLVEHFIDVVNKSKLT